MSQPPTDALAPLLSPPVPNPPGETWRGGYAFDDFLTLMEFVVKVAEAGLGAGLLPDFSVVGGARVTVSLHGDGAGALGARIEALAGHLGGHAA